MTGFLLATVILVEGAIIVILFALMTKTDRIESMAKESRDILEVIARRY